MNVRNDIAGLFGDSGQVSPSDETRAAAKQHLRGVIAASSKPRREHVRRVPRGGLLVAALVLGLGVTAAIAAKTLRDGPASTASFPIAAGAQHCITRLNEFATPRMRQRLRDGGPFKPFLDNRWMRGLGTPESAHFSITPSGEIACEAVVTFRRGNVVTGLAFGVLGLKGGPRLEPIAAGQPTASHAARMASTTINPDGTFSTNVLPPAAIGAWNTGKLTARAHLISAPRIPITGPLTCVHYSVTLNRDGRIGALLPIELFPPGSPVPRQYGPSVDYPVRAGEPFAATGCFRWGRYWRNPVEQSRHDSHPDRRTIDIAAYDRTQTVQTWVSLSFKLLPANPAVAHPHRWVLVYQAR